MRGIGCGVRNNVGSGVMCNEDGCGGHLWQILYDDGEQEILNLAKERWELTGKQGKASAKKEKVAAGSVCVGVVVEL